MTPVVLERFAEQDDYRGNDASCKESVVAGEYYVIPEGHSLRSRERLAKATYPGCVVTTGHREDAGRAAPGSSTRYAVL